MPCADAIPSAHSATATTFDSNHSLTAVTWVQVRPKAVQRCRLTVNVVCGACRDVWATGKSSARLCWHRASPFRYQLLLHLQSVSPAWDQAHSCDVQCFLQLAACSAALQLGACRTWSPTLTAVDGAHQAQCVCTDLCAAAKLSVVCFHFAGMPPTAHVAASCMGAVILHGTCCPVASLAPMWPPQFLLAAS